MIRSGEVEVFFKDDTGTRIVLDTAEAGDVFGELSLLDGGRARPRWWPRRTWRPSASTAPTWTTS